MTSTSFIKATLRLSAAVRAPSGGRAALIRSPVGALAAALASCAISAHAATVTVLVNGSDGAPAPNVVVQIVLAHPVPFKLPAAPVLIAQRDIRFVPYLTAVPVGTTVRFSNQDPFDHHLRSEPGGPFGNVAPAKEFEMRLPAASGDKVSSAELKFDKAGAMVLGCHLHGSMRGHLFVSDTPYVAVTDVNGHASINDVPEGAVEVRAWSPDQLTEQAPATRRITGASVILDTTLNFTPPKPRRRRS